MLAKLIKEQERSTEEIALLRTEMKNFVREVRKDRLAFIETMREQQPQATSAPEDTESASEKKEKREGRLSLKGILIGLAGLTAALIAFKDQIPEAIKNAFLGGVKNFFSGGEGSLGISAGLTAGTITASSMAARKLGDVASTKIDESVDAKTARKVEAERARVAAQNKSNALSNISDADRTQLQRQGITERGGKLYDKKDRVIPDSKVDAALKKANIKLDIPEVSVEASRATKMKAAVEKTVKKAGPKAVAKTVPFLGAIAGVGFGLSRLLEGDVTGALLDVGAAASSATGVGAPVAAAASIYSLARDAYHAAFPEENLEESLANNPEETGEKFATILEMVKSSVAEMMKGSEEGATQVPSGQRRRAARGRRGAAESTDVSPAETTPMPATDTSTRLQVSGAVGEGTSEAVASGAGAPSVTVLNSSQSNQTAISGAGGAPTREVTISPVSRNASTIDAYAVPI